MQPSTLRGNSPQILISSGMLLQKQKYWTSGWAPNHIASKRKEMDFRVGGRWLYTMVSPENVPLSRYSLAEFIEIQPKSSFTTKNSFADENGNPVDSGFSFSITKNSFKAEGEKTTVYISKKMQSLAELEKFIELGFEQGTAAGMKNLDEYFLSLVTSK